MNSPGEAGKSPEGLVLSEGKASRPGLSAQEDVDGVAEDDVAHVPVLARQRHEQAAERRIYGNLLGRALVVLENLVSCTRTLPYIT